MNESTPSLSTRQASELLGVHESSIKRWCNADELDHWLTPGGHRRIPVPALIAFADARDLPLPLSAFGSHASDVWAGLDQFQRTDDAGQLVDLVYGWMGTGRSRQVAHLVHYLREQGEPLTHVFDHLIGPAMRRVGLEYLRGNLSIGDEHHMTQTIRDALVQVRLDVAPPEPVDGEVRSRAIVGCARGEVHELGALMVRAVLENEGWHVVYLGLDVPTEEFAAQQLKHGAALVCVSMIPPLGLAEAQTMVRLLSHMADAARPYHLALGGGAFGGTTELDDATLPTRLFQRMGVFAEWVRNLPA